jgi:hypothetical protein
MCSIAPAPKWSPPISAELTQWSVGPLYNHNSEVWCRLGSQSSVNQALFLLSIVTGSVEINCYVAGHNRNVFFVLTLHVEPSTADNSYSISVLQPRLQLVPLLLMAFLALQLQWWHFCLPPPLKLVLVLLSELKYFVNILFWFGRHCYWCLPTSAEPCGSAAGNNDFWHFYLVLAPVLLMAFLSTNLSWTLPHCSLK